MAEILVRAINYSHIDPEKDRIGAYKTGYPVIAFNDGHEWSHNEGLPRFFIIKVPGISVDKVNKYIQPELVDGNQEIHRRRLWQIQKDELPQAARNKIKNNGELIIKAGNYSGSFDYTWSQVKQYFKNLKTNLRETGDL